jgi:peptidoglycan hydrolase CwlO-like protein
LFHALNYLCLPGLDPVKVGTNEASQSFFSQEPLGASTGTIPMWHAAMSSTRKTLIPINFGAPLNASFELYQLKQKNERLKKENEELKQQIEQLKESIKKPNDRIDTLEEIIEERDEDIDTLKKEID